MSRNRLCLRLIGAVTVVLRKTGHNMSPTNTTILVTTLAELALIHTAVSFASFFLTTPVERHLNTVSLGAGSGEMMHDYPLHV